MPLFKKSPPYVHCSHKNENNSINRVATEIARLDNKHPEKKHSEKDARSEIVARACEDMLSMSKEGRKMFDSLSESEQKTFVDKVKEIIENIKEWIDELLGQYSSTSYEAKALRQQEEQLNEVLKLWDEMLVESKKVNEAGVFKAEKNTTTEGGVEFCDRSNYANEFNPDGLSLNEQLTEAYDSAKPKDRRYVYVGKFTQSFVEKLKNHLSIKDLPIVMNYRDAYLSMHSKESGKYKGEGINYHNLGIEGLEAALKLFDSPEYVLMSKKEGKIELILEGRDYKNRQLFSIVEVNTKTQNDGKFFSVHVVNSVYGNRSIQNRIDLAEKEGRKIYDKKEESTQGISQVQYERDINVNSSKDSIHNPDEFVNTKFSDRDNEYMKAVESGDIETAQRMVDEAAKEAGYTVKAYHGTSRADRVGNVFLPERATSGPMAYFTDNKDIASNYARDKADTSLAYDEEYDSYYTQFRVNRNGKSISISELWKHLSVAERNRIKELAGHIKFDDNYETIIVDKTAQHGNGAWDAYTLNMHRGNALEALVDTWLETGDLYRQEERFLDVLERVGITDAEYRNPDARHEKVYDTWLKMTKPFDTDDANKSFYDSLSEWIENNDMSVYEKESANADMWDKNNQSPESWFEKLGNDIENGTTNAWTVIPDFVTDYLKTQKYDGVKDKGGKGGGEGHTVWIPFFSEQIKSADPVTYDNDGNVIPLSERFNESNNDIRYSDRTGNISIDDVEKFDYSQYNEIKLPYAEQEKVQSEFLTWHANKRNQLISKTLSNGTTYRCVIDDDGVVHVYGRHSSQNIHKGVREFYANNNTEELGSLAKELRAGSRNDGLDSRFGENGRESRKDDTSDNYFVSGEGRSNRTGYSKNRNDTNRKPKEYRFNEDGTAEITYSDGTKTKFADRTTESTTYDLMGETARLKKENEQFKADIDRLRERLKIEKQVTHGNYFNENQLNAVAGHLRKISNSDISNDELV